jgi:MFS family permease
LLQGGQLLSTLGSRSSSIAYPLLVLAITGSPAKAGVVSFARVIPFLLFSAFSGVAADRWNRKWLMIGADAVRAVALTGLVVPLALGRLPFWLIPVVAFVEGAASTVFGTAHSGARRAVVPAPQLPAATATEVARESVVRLAGPPLGGILFGLGRVVPFAVDAASYACSTISLLLMRTPFQQERERDESGVRAQIAEGFRYLWSQPFIRTCALLFGIANFIFPGVLLAIVVVGRRQGLSSGEIGALTASFGAALLVGSALSALSRRYLSVRAILLLELWTWSASGLFLVWPNVYVLTASTVPQMLTVPSTDSVVHSLRIAMTPDRLVGRVDGAATNISLLITPLGPLLCGFLLSAASPRTAIAVFAAAGLVLAVWGTLSPAIRRAPSLDELHDLAPEPMPVEPTEAPLG